MSAVRRVLIPLSVLSLCLTFGVWGCGDDSGGESIFLYVTNGYPGADSMTLIGPTGTIASGLPFGARTAEPVEVDRNVNSSDFQVIIDGAPETMSVGKNLFALYPQETATMFISRRSGEASAEATFYRHIRSPDPDCLLTFGNSLSLSEAHMAGDFLTFSYQTEWQRDPKPMYDASRENLASTRCGFTQIPQRFKRPQLHTQIQNDNWFVPVTGGDENDKRYQLVWAERRIDPRTGNLRSEGIVANGVRAEPTTKDFIECLSGAVSIKKEEDSGGGGIPSLPGGDEEECPAATGNQAQLPDGEQVTLMGSDQVVWDDESARECTELRRYGGFSVAPASPDSFQVFELAPNADRTCGFPVRFRTPTMDLIFQTQDSDEGDFITTDVTFPMSEQHFVVLFGRPINAFIDQWNADETAVSLDEYPYPGDLEPNYSQDN